MGPLDSSFSPYRTQEQSALSSRIKNRSASYSKRDQTFAVAPYFFPKMLPLTSLEARRLIQASQSISHKVSGYSSIFSGFLLTAPRRGK